VNFVDAETEAEHIEERRAKDSPRQGRAVEDSLVWGISGRRVSGRWISFLSVALW